MASILVVEDDADMIDLVRRHLEDEGHQVRSASHLTEALTEVTNAEPDLLLLDIVLGADDGREVLREVRTMSDVPVIFITGRGLESDRIAGLKMGADDYLVKPFSLGELSARIESVLRRTAGSLGRVEGELLVFGPLAINDGTHEVHLRGEMLELTAKEYSLLLFLASSPRQVFSRQQLLEHVWDSSSEWQNEATVTEHIRRLRLKIETDPDHPRWILTVRGFGYRFEPAS
ncbi:MAG: response regulator transcription factor [Acidobacteria bacterium]|nr:response regulator transcription factor [Acidobacteriota bacterium]